MKLGDIVYWETPRPKGAGLLSHQGKIIEVVPSGGVPSWKWSCSPRNHESYLVEEQVDGRKPETFWPRVKWFK